MKKDAGDKDDDDENEKMMQQIRIRKQSRQLCR
jgi:hypothetical protein